MLYQRRDFLKSAIKLSYGLVLTSISNKVTGCNVSKVNNSNVAFGLQLYTLRDDMPKNPKEVLRQVASYGYRQIESYEHKTLGIFWGMDYKEFKTYVDGLGMQLIASHCDIDKNFEQKADQAAAIGMKYLICPWIGPQKSLDDYKRAADKFNNRGEICKKAGLKFAYHNHDYSFIPIENRYPQDIIMQHTDKDLVDYEMDIYWVVTAGQNPIHWLNKYPDRFKLSHIKDRKKSVSASEKNASTILGTGQIDFAKVLKIARKNGMNYFIVEQELYEHTTPLAAIERNAEYMKQLKP